MSDKSYHHGDLKAELIREGLLILDKEGYEGFSLRKVAKACNVSQTAPYRHFKDKNELIQAISLEALSKFNQCLEKAVEDNPDNPHKQLNEMGVAYIKFFVENPEYFRLLFLSDYQGKICVDFRSQTEHLTSDNPFYTFHKTVERVHAAFPDPPISLDEMTLSCWGLVHGISLLISHQDFKTDKNYLELVQNIFRIQEYR
jgi:AcrR family transcriptional regulator